MEVTATEIVGGGHWFGITTEAGAAPGALDRIITLPFGQYPGVAFLDFATIDAFVHGWDLARATHQDTDLAPELAVGLLAFLGRHP